MAGFEGRTWRLTRGVAVDPERPITARFVDGTVSGTIGTTHYRAAYEGGGDRLGVGPASLGGPVEDRAYPTLLESVAAARTGERSLELLDEAGTTVLAFEPAPAVPASLVGRWSVVAVPAADDDEGGGDGDGDGDGGIHPGDAWLTFAEDGAVTGHGGINGFGSQARTDGDRLYLGPVRMTRMGGEPDAMAAEAAIGEALGRVATYRQDADRLELADADGELLLRLRRS